MKKSKILFSAILSITCFSLIKSVNLREEKDCGEGCAECDYGGCYTCFKHYIRVEDETGFSYCSGASPLQSDHCDLYFQFHNKCNICSRGYTKNNEICQKSEIPMENCVFRNINIFTKQEVCVICDGGIPDVNGICQNFPEEVKEYKNCAWGIKGGGQRACFKCKRGYVMDETTKYNCIEDKEREFEGCIETFLHEGEIKCQICDVWNGYSMRDPRTRECERG